MNYVKEELAKQNVKSLLVIAKELAVIGRYDMNKEDLINSIIHYDTLLDIADVGKHYYRIPGETDVEFRLRINKIQKEKEQLIKCTDTCLKDCEVEQCVKCTNDTSMKQETSELKVYKPKVDYIANIKKGTLVAFKINGEKVLSGKVDIINEASLSIVTKNGIRFEVFKNNIIWVRTGLRWPRGVYLALRGEMSCDENRRPELV